MGVAGIPDTVAARVSLFRVGHREAAVPAINHAIANIDRHNHNLISCPQDEDFDTSRIEEKNQAKACCNIKPGDHRYEHSHHCYATHPNDVSPVIMQDIGPDCAEHPPNHRENNQWGKVYDNSFAAKNCISGYIITPCNKIAHKSS